MINLSQRDPRWGNKTLGFSNTLIKDYGCVITCLAMILGTTPDVVNEKLKSVKGFSGNLVIWSRIEKAFPEASAYRYYGYDNNKVKAAVPNVLVESSAFPIGGTGKHWTVYIGNQRLNDPWTGRQRSTAEFPGQSGFTIITLKNPPQDGDDVKLNQVKSVVDGSGTPHDKIEKIRSIVA